jgi:hypothetical protein
MAGIDALRPGKALGLLLAGVNPENLMLSAAAGAGLAAGIAYIESRARGAKSHPRSSWSTASSRSTRMGLAATTSGPDRVAIQSRVREIADHDGDVAPILTHRLHLRTLRFPV